MRFRAQRGFSSQSWPFTKRGRARLVLLQPAPLAHLYNRLIEQESRITRKQSRKANNYGSPFQVIFALTRARADETRATRDSPARQPRQETPGSLKKERTQPRETKRFRWREEDFGL